MIMITERAKHWWGIISMIKMSWLASAAVHYETVRGDGVRLGSREWKITDCSRAVLICRRVNHRAADDGQSLDEAQGPQP